MVLFEVKQHKYKLVLGWVTVSWVVLFIDRSHIIQEPNAVIDPRNMMILYPGWPPLIGLSALSVPKSLDIWEIRFAQNLYIHGIY